MQNYYNSNLSQMSYGNNNFGINNNDYTNPFGVINNFPSSHTPPIQQSTLSNTSNYMSGYSDYQPFSNKTYDTSLENWPYKYCIQDQRTYCPPANHNYLSPSARINALRNEEKLNFTLRDNPSANYNWPLHTLHPYGDHYVKKYNDKIDKYANQYGVDPDMVKAIMYSEGATGHYLFGNYLGDLFHTSKSQMPMNIQGRLWGNFDGQQYDTYDPEQNIELGTRLIKRITDSLDNPTPDRIGTLWNDTGENEINDFGGRVQTAYDTKPWQNNLFYISPYLF